MVSQFTPDQDIAVSDESISTAQGRASHAAATDPGCEREKNEDRFLVVSAPAGNGYLVFDGMGGEPGGEAAAQISADAIERYMRNAQPTDVEALLCAAIDCAQETLIDHRKQPQMQGMGTTVVGAFCRGAEIAIAAVGDSRAYCVNKGGVTQITCDHTLVQELVDSGQIAPQDALVHPQSHVLTRCLGSETNSRVDSKKFWVWPTKLGQGCDTLVLCSDGLYSLVSDDELHDIVGGTSPTEAARSLVTLARERGGFDNITVVIVPLPGVLKAEAPRAHAEEVQASNSRTTVGVVQRSASWGDEDSTRAKVSKQDSLSRLSIPSRLVEHACNVFALSFFAACAAVLTFAVLTMFKE
jgi:serine/threonine protein phosphatase PrpC